MTMNFSVRVYFEDTDFSGRVYHGAFVRFLERGRTELLRERAIDHRALAERDPPLFFTLRALRMTFHGPALIDDLLVVTTAPGESSRASIDLAQSIRRGSTVIVRAEVQLCLIDAEGRPQRPPREVRAVFDAG
jgi:acyl-CoA thioester hydrolase